MKNDSLQLGSKSFQSRLFLGTGRFSSLKIMQQCHQATETELVTVALRRLDLSGIRKNLLDFIDQNKITILVNTSGVQTAKEAYKIAEILPSLNLQYLKIEVSYEPKTLLPDPVETLNTVKLIREKYNSEQIYLMVYTNDDPILAHKLVQAGADCIMPAGSPIGSGGGIRNPDNLKLMKDILPSSTPLILDAGIGSAKDAIEAMEIGFSAVLMNTAIAQAEDPIEMALAMKYAVIAGRKSYLAGRIPRKNYATASSPLK